MTTEEKLDVLIDTVQNFTNVMLTTMQGVATIVRANNESSDPTTYEIDGKTMTLAEYQNMVAKMQLDAQYEEMKIKEQARNLEAERLKNLEDLAKETENA